ncbi:RNase E specificity factor CsrD [Vibrio sp. Of7-15]|uniref:RNase E specificity factor CsrD n=1 Tax=Vibrio sp. Of7-15 TaxID=2724879 RepID=UPI001EF23CB5|nr:RNase E specificity factor CsrD [Vibrio sp. Of7-15]MCG7498520.1 RNase E specificity factor CsrD [Vibrio sp. Of7-15]
MRKTPTLRLSNRLVAFVTLIVVSAIFVIFVGGAISFKKIGNEHLNHYLEGIVDVIDQEMSDPEDAESLSRWLPKLLKASNVVEMSITTDAGPVYSFKEIQLQLEPSLLYQKRYPLELNQGYYIEFKTLPAYSSFTYSIGAMFSITAAIMLIIAGLIWGLSWLKRQLHGSELLEERGRMILAGHVEPYAIGSEDEWPATASLALDQLISELQDARQERSRFDTFIRTHTFLDQLTGSANRVLFDSKLESVLQESDSQGAVLLIRFDEWEEVLEHSGKELADELIVESGGLLSNLIQRYPDVVLSRYYESDFAILIPHQSVKDIMHFSAQVLRVLERLSPPEPLHSDNWCHIGVTMFGVGERRGRVMDEVEMALRSAKLQNANSWSLFKKGQQEQTSRGNVRWRSLFDAVFEQKELQLYKQPVFMEGGKTPLHYELLARIKDENGFLIKASRFLPAIEQVGYQIRMDRRVVTQTLTLLRKENGERSYSVNLHVLSLQDKSFNRWLRDELLQLPRMLLKHLSFEFVEGSLVTHLDFVRPVVRMLSGLGCKIVVDQAGRTIVSTHYIKDLKVDYLKLHRSLMRDIHQRYENQLFVRSIIGACADSNAKVIAVGVEKEKEWHLLKELGVSGGQGRFFNAETSLHHQPKKVQQPKRRNRWARK